MKFNFKKVIPILTGAILLGSTIGFAAGASFPNDYKSAVVVIGSDSDLTAANLVAGALGTTSASITGGDRVQIETSSNKLNLAENLTDVRTTTLDHSDLKTVLKTSTFRAKSGDYDFEQKLQLAGGLMFTHFKDSSFSSDPVLGIKLASNRAPVMNYTLQFTKNAQSAVSTTSHLTDFETKNIEILGKSYTILNAYNATAGTGGSLTGVKLVLMGGSIVETIAEGTPATYTLNGTPYVVEATIGQDKVKLVVNGRTTDSLSAGDTYKLDDGTQVGVRDFLYNSKVGSVSTVDFTLGAQKLTIQDGQTVQMNDNDVNGLKAFISAAANSNKVDISAITLEWKTDARTYLTDGSSITMPGLGSVSLQIVGGFTTPKTESVMIENDGTNAMQVTWPFKDGSYTFDVGYTNASGSFLGYGYDANNALAVGTTTLSFDADTDKYFVVSYLSGTAAESYVLSASTSNPLSTGGYNRTTIHNEITGSDVCVDRTPASGLNTCTVGNVVLTVTAVNPDQNNVTLSANSGSRFDRAYSAEGLTMILSLGKLLFIEADKDHNIATTGAVFNVTLTGASSDGKTSVSSSAQGVFAGAIGESSPNINSKQIGDSKVFESYLQSKLATKFLYDTNPTQSTLEIEYHGGESYGNVWVTAADVVAQSKNVFKESELSAAQKAGDVIVVGGPAVNSIAASMLGLNTADLTLNQGAASKISPDTAVIQSLSYNPGKLALLVAGYEQADTLAAAKELVANKDAAIGKTLTKTGAATYTVA